MGIATDNGTRGFGLGGELYFKKDTYRITAGFTLITTFTELGRLQVTQM